jgi:hypothetical protein
MLLLGTGFGIAASGLLHTVLDWPDGCKALMDAACASPELTKAFGGHPTASIFWKGVSHPGFVRVVIPLHGANGVSAKLVGSAVRNPMTGRWDVVAAEVVFPDGVSEAAAAKSLDLVGGVWAEPEEDIVYVESDVALEALRRDQKSSPHTFQLKRAPNGDQ